jgi:diadenosine tetraphosphate (Ap4A) HIT family hydrolase
MGVKNCIFCKIIKGEINSAKIWEDKNFVAILDIQPNVKGMTLLITKRHYDSYVFNMPDKLYVEFLLTAKKISRILKKGLNVKRVALVMEGMGINHAHLKFYPLYGIKEKFQEMWAKEKVFFTKYPGYITTQLGPRVDIKKLKKLAKKMISK